MLRYTLTVVDPQGESDQHDVVVTVVGTNDGPQLTVGPLHVAENSVTGTAIGTLVGSDVDASDVLMYQLLDDAGGRFVVDASSGQLSVLDGGLLDFEASGSHQVWVRVTDTRGSLAELWGTVIVDNVNEAPLVTPHQYEVDYLTELRSVVGELLAGTSDAEGDVLSTRLLTPPEAGRLLVWSDGSFVYWPSVHGVGTYTFVVEVSDGALVTPVTHTIVVTRPVLLPPGFGADSGVRVEEVSGSGDDGPASDTSREPGESDGELGQGESPEAGSSTARASGTESVGEPPGEGVTVQHRVDGPGLAGIGRRVMGVERGSMEPLVSVSAEAWTGFERDSVESELVWRQQGLGRMRDVDSERRGWLEDGHSSGDWWVDESSMRDITAELKSRTQNSWDVSWETHSEVAMTVGVTAVWLVFHGRVLAAAAAADVLREAVDPTLLLEQFGRR